MDIQSGVIRSLPQYDDDIDEVQYSKMGDLVAISNHDTVMLYQSTTFDEIVEFRFNDTIFDIEISNDDRLLAIGHGDGLSIIYLENLTYWNITNGPAVLRLTFSYDNHRLACWTSDTGVISFWNTRTWALIHNFSFQFLNITLNSIKNLIFSPTHNHLYLYTWLNPTTFEDIHEIQVLDTANYSVIRSLRLYDWPVKMIVTKDGSHLMYIGFNKFIIQRLYDGKLIQKVTLNQEILDFAICSDEKDIYLSRYVGEDKRYSCRIELWGLDFDKDGCPNSLDAFPRDSNECSDLDGDGIGDNADPIPSFKYIRSWWEIGAITMFIGIFFVWKHKMKKQSEPPRRKQT